LSCLHQKLSYKNITIAEYIIGLPYINAINIAAQEGITESQQYSRLGIYIML
jgi:hypothetical protein